LFIFLIHAEKTIFYDMNINRDIDILLCGALGRHYPLRNRFKEILKKMPSKYNCIEHKHPGYNYGDSYTNKYLKIFAEEINRAKICLTCTSKYKYRLGKMVEIPMCGSVLACDLPGQDENEFKEFMIVLDEKMTDNEIVNKLIYYLENNHKLIELKQKGLIWSQNYIQEYYAIKLHNELNLLKNYRPRIFVLGDEMKNTKIKWICDILKEEFMNFNYNYNYNFTLNPNNADIFWLLAPWSHRKINKEILKNRFVITTIHHIDWEKYEENKEYYEYIESITNKYHVICDKTKIELEKLTKKEIIVKNFWINQNNYYRMQNIKRLKEKYELENKYYLIGSFQKDTEGKDDTLPKYSKGPDIFLKIVEDINKTKKVMVILTGWRRTYIMKELDKLKIKYKYFEMLENYQINELYNCLDLYIVASRVEGGPRSIIECGLAKVPIISTNVGISNLILHPNSIYDMNNYLTYKIALENIQEKVDYAYNKAEKYKINVYIEEFIKDVFSFL
jgi:hypothetical protein